MIVTFYSYKGGVGRSMALANVARWFELQGLRVVMIDWDLEAPGLESFFFADDASRTAIRGRLGLIDLLGTYKDIFRSLPKPTARGPDGAGPTSGTPDTMASRFAAVLTGAMPPLRQLLVPIGPSASAPANDGGLWLLPAGARSDDRFTNYAEVVQAFDWAEFYTAYEGEAYFEWLRGQLLDPSLADVVLIDSRTGVAEMSGVCTRHLADVVVNLCAPNDQNLEGVAMMARSFVRADVIEARGGRPLDLVMVGARIDLTEGRPIDLFEERFHLKLDGYLPEAFRRAKTSFQALRIPYVSTYAYSERLAVGDPQGVKTLQDTYERLAAHIALLALPGTALRQKCYPVLQRLFTLPRVHVAALDGECDALAVALAQRLEQAGIFALRTPTFLASGALPAELTGNEAGAIIVVAAPSALYERPLREVGRRLRSQGVPHYIVSPGGMGSDSALPPGLGHARIFDPSRDFSDLVAQLERSVRPARVPFLAPPAAGTPFARGNELNALKAMLLTDRGRSPRVALVGMGGIGKSTLARALCNDDDVIDFFEAGILWAPIKAEPDARSALVKWVAAFEGDAAVVLDPDEAERRLAPHLANAHCLLVVEDVLDASHLERIPVGARCTLLVTTRLHSVAAAARAAIVDLRALGTDESRQILMAELPSGADPALVHRLVELLGGSPLAMQLANRELHSRLERGSRIGDALASLVEALEREGLDAFGEASSTSLAAFTLTLEQLPASDRASLPLLASLPFGQPVSLESPSMNGITDAARLMQRLSAASLVDFDAKSGTVVIPALTHAFARSLENRRKRAEEVRRAGTTPARFPVYISYRRADAASAAGRLYDSLTLSFGGRTVFMDVSDIEIGQDWRDTLTRAVLDASAVVAVIGPHWLKGSGERESPLANEDDAVRRELAVALAHGRLVVPVLVDGALMPRPDELPGDLRELAYRNAVELRHDSFNQDVDRLIDSLKRIASSPPPAERDLDAPASASFPRRRPEASAPAAQDDATATFGRLSRAAPTSSGRWRRLTVAAGVLVGVAVGGALWLGQRSGGPTPPVDVSPSPSPSPSPLPTPPVIVPPGPFDGGEAEKLFTDAENVYFGRGLPKDNVRAMGLYRKAAALNYAPAMNALGRMYENGEGVAQDRVTALQWYEAAAKRGHPDALAALNRFRRPSRPPTTQP